VMISCRKKRKNIFLASAFTSPFLSLPTLSSWKFLFIFRLLNAFSVQTFFNPDEYWQSLEIAHKITFGYGYLSWEWREGIRSFFHPLLFAAIYKFLEIFHLDFPFAVIYFPRIFQAAASALGDLYLYKLTKRLFPSDQTAKWALLCQLANWFTFYCIVRTFSNSLETVLTTMALFYWDWPGWNSKPVKNLQHTHSTRSISLFLAIISFLIRPTSAVLWLFLGIDRLLKFSDFKSRVQFLLRELLPIGTLGLLLQIVIDFYFYGRKVFSLWNFVRFNIFNDSGSFYGTHPFYWYFILGFPSMIGPLFPCFVLGCIILIKEKRFPLLWIIFWYNFTLSFTSHKEFRFVLPALPLAMICSGRCFQHFLRYSRRKSFLNIGVIHCKWKTLFAVLLLFNIPIALYFSLFHQRGSISVMSYIQTLDMNRHSVHFLMPCHSTPYYSHVHQNISMRFLDCSPSNEINYLDEAERFKMDPLTFVSNYYHLDDPKTRSHSLPSHFVLFSSFLPSLESFFKRISYHECVDFFHAVSFSSENHVILYEKVLVYCNSKEK